MMRRRKKEEERIMENWRWKKRRKSMLGIYRRRGVVRRLHKWTIRTTPGT
jgi:hypothetical protein